MINNEIEVGLVDGVGTLCLMLQEGRYEGHLNALKFPLES